MTINPVQKFDLRYTIAKEMREGEMAGLETRDDLLLGRTQSKLKFGAEMYAGVRAELTPTHLNKALTSSSGRIIGRMMVSLMGAARLYHQHRMTLITDLIKEALPPGKQNPTLVDAAAGLSPAGILLAQALPDATVIELDVPETITEKQRRLRSLGFPIPPNFKQIATDLKNVPLKEALKDQQIDVIWYASFNFAPDELIRLAAYLRGMLTPDGANMCIAPWHEGMMRSRETVNLMRRQSQQETPGAMHSEAEAQEIFHKAGYSRVATHPAERLMIEKGYTQAQLPGTDLFIVARM
jgi:O-methyltransferase involved in polyketide biosynthesis